MDAPAGGLNDDRTALYRTLEVASTASPEEIKRAYRRLALRYHPDKNPGENERFQAVNHAYEILGDPKKRSVYDRYGEIGVNMLSSVGGTLLDPDIGDMLCTFFFFSTLAVALVIVFLSFLSVRVDNNVSWNYATVFIPLWIIDAIVLAYLVRLLLRDIKKPSESINLDAEDELESEDHSLSERERSKTERQRRAKRIAIVNNTLSLFYFAMVVLFQAFVVIRANNTVTWSVAIVFIPLYVVELMNAVRVVATVVNVLRVVPDDAPEDYTHWRSRAVLVFNATWLYILRVLQIILIVLRIDTAITVSWGVIFIPMYLVGLRVLAFIVVGFLTIRFIQPAEVRNRARIVFGLSFAAFAIPGTLIYSFIGLLAEKLDMPQAIAMAVVCIPLFILLSFAFCCFCCCLPCLFIGAIPPGLDSNAQPVPLDRRITFTPVESAA